MFKRKELGVNKALVAYVEGKYYSMYDTFDGAHNTEHIEDVIEESLSIYENVQMKGEIPEALTRDMVYAAAALHDIGISIEREGHCYHSQKMILNDTGLKEFFTDAEIEYIALAVSEHSSSIDSTIPVSYFGMIIADGDKDYDSKVCLTRAYKYALTHQPELTVDERIRLCFDHLNTKYGRDGRVKYFINNETEFKATMLYLLGDFDVFERRMKILLPMM